MVALVLALFAAVARAAALEVVVLARRALPAAIGERKVLLFGLLLDGSWGDRKLAKCRHKFLEDAWALIDRSLSHLLGFVEAILADEGREPRLSFHAELKLGCAIA